MDALGHASDLARRAVVRPVEGAILTVAAAAAGGAANGSSLVGRGRGARGEAADALARTPEMLPVLAQAGGMDAGGAGPAPARHVLFVLDRGQLRSRRAWPPDLSALNGSLAAGGSGVTGRATERTPSANFATGHLLLARPDDSIEAFKEVSTASETPSSWSGETASGTATSTPTTSCAAIEAGVDAGRPQRNWVADLDEQVEEERWVHESVRCTRGRPEHGGHGPPPTTSVVAVVSGDGIGRIFRSWGPTAWS